MLQLHYQFLVLTYSSANIIILVLLLVDSADRQSIHPPWVLCTLCHTRIAKLIMWRELFAQWNCWNEKCCCSSQKHAPVEIWWKIAWRWKGKNQQSSSSSHHWCQPYSILITVFTAVKGHPSRQMATAASWPMHQAHTSLQPERKSSSTRNSCVVAAGESKVALCVVSGCRQHGKGHHFASWW